MVKNWLFGKKRKEDADALATLKAQQNRLQAESRNLERQADEQKTLAAKMLQAGNKAGARQALKRRAVFMKRLNTVHNTAMNLQAQIDSIQTATSTADTVQAMELGTKVVGEKIKTVSPERTERVMDAVMEQRDQIEMMTEALSDPSLSEGVLDFEDDAAIDEQLAQLEAEMDLGKTTSLPDVTGLPSTPVGTTKESGEDTSDLEEELESLKKKVSEDKG
ncbi:MAG: Snf7 family protein [Candidatus Heimdallarchaeaceae archaeon]|jgi:charged multivesicular body protein 4